MEPRSRFRMPTSLDVYVTCAARDRETVNRFLDAYVDRATSEDRGEEDLLLLRLGHEPDGAGDWEHEPARTLTAIVDRGLAAPWRAFTVYLRTPDPRCNGAILAFTSDGRVVFGLSVPDLADESSIGVALAMLHELAELFAADEGMVAAEEPPPLTPLDARAERRVLYRWSRAQHGP